MPEIDTPSTPVLETPDTTPDATPDTPAEQVEAPKHTTSPSGSYLTHTDLGSQATRV